MTEMYTNSVPIGSRITWNAYGSNIVDAALMLGKIRNQDNILVGWKDKEIPSHGGNIGWLIDSYGREAMTVLKNNNCVLGWWLTENQIVSVIDSHSHKPVVAKGGFDGCMCDRCLNFFPMAAPNRPNSKMICWSCRQGWIPKDM